MQFFTCVSRGISPAQILLIVQGTVVIHHSIFYFPSFSMFLRSRNSKYVVICSFCSFLFFSAFYVFNPILFCSSFFYSLFCFLPLYIHFIFLSPSLFSFQIMLSFLFSFPITLYFFLVRISDTSCAVFLFFFLSFLFPSILFLFFVCFLFAFVSILSHLLFSSLLNFVCYSSSHTIDLRFFLFLLLPLVS